MYSCKENWFGCFVGIREFSSLLYEGISVIPSKQASPEALLLLGNERESEAAETMKAPARKSAHT